MKKLKLPLFTLTMMLVVAACSNTDVVDKSESVPVKGDSADTEGVVENEEVDGKRTFTIDIKEEHWMLNDDLMFDAWTYNGTLPGEEIRVTEGDHVVMKFTNSLDVPTAVHLHGFPVPNEMDGVPGVTQNAIMPGEEFIYEYQADVPGTYWYHSHQNGSVQVDKGLYGLFIVEPKDQPAYDVDKVIAIDEWSLMMDSMNDIHGSAGVGHGGHGGHGGHMNHGDMNHGMSHADMMNMMYDTLVINGKATPAIEPVVVKEGNVVKLRFLNAGLFTQVVSIPGHSFKITHYDGQKVNEPEFLTDTAFRIAPAERFEVEIEMDQPGAWGIEIFAEENKKNLQGLVPLVYEGYEEESLVTSSYDQTFFDITSYGEARDIEIGEVTKEFDMLLGSEDGDETFTINGKQYPDPEVYEVEEGDVVKFTITNDTGVEHPMHLHGEFFYVISKDGKPITGSPIKKDTLNVRPDETYEIVFEAKNPGNWMFHCHEFHHANGGMVASVIYKGYEPNFELDPNVPNQPE
ncbi:multicopper oxidase family protein [Bacillus sp. FJAT-45350]|uniref:multicopper oxidase family protein n=1 Tax=Bacillus sp. FJAT-45350 TaxID=2011014 RepID=UPI000BB867E7|nr:multicopper oxidase family protein [Bacillus sp. FJAT-45350]